MKKISSGYIYKTFKKEDKDTAIRRLNVRNFAKAYNVDHTVCQDKWLIDFFGFMKKLNPNHISESCEMPRLRTKIGTINEWNYAHRKKIKHHIIDKICDSGAVMVYKYGQHNIINYDEIEQELIRILKDKDQY